MNLPALKTAADWCVKHSIIIPDDIVAGLYQHGVDVKTPGYYARVMWEAVRELYAGDIEAYDFEEVMLRLISEQLRKAWNEGMRQLELDPETDQTEEGEAYLQEIMASELDYVGQLAEDIIAAAEQGQSVKGGEGSGNFDHEGRPGEVGGSAPSGGGRERVQQSEGGGRASGGVITEGINQRDYLGGQFLPNSTEQNASQERARMEKRSKEYMQRKQEIAPFVYDTPPTPSSTSVYKEIAGVVPYEKPSDTFTIVGMSQNTIQYAGGIERIGPLVSLYNSGVRWTEMNQQKFDNIYKPKK